MDGSLQRQLNDWYNRKEYDNIIRILEEGDEQNYDSIVLLSKAYALRGKKGDLERSKELLKMIEDIENLADLETYNKSDLARIDTYISQTFGSFTKVFHEIVSTDIQLDIYVIPPGEGRDFYTLVTMGMGAHRMNVPTDLQDVDLDRAELMICLPRDWNLDSGEEKWYWPIRLLKILARLPIQEKGWLGWGHTVDYDETFDDSTELCGAMLIDPVDFGDILRECTLNDGSRINFYQVIPLYREELEFKRNGDAESLLKKLSANVTIVNSVRKNYCQIKILS